MNRKKRVISGAIIAALILALLVPAVPSFADPDEPASLEDVTVEETSASQSLEGQMDESEALSSEELPLEETVVETVEESTEEPDDPENYGPDILAKTYCVLDGETGEVLMSKNKDRRMYPASTTKILTALITFEEVQDLYQKVTFTRTAVDVDPSSTTLPPKAMVGEEMRIIDIVYGMMFASGNECGKMLGEVVGGSEEAFAEMMNERVKKMGLVNSHFTNAYGIHNDDHYTTAYDLAVIMREAMENEKFRELMAAKTYTIPQTNMCGERPLVMGHKMVNGEVPEEGVIGGKTGRTPQAGCTLATAVNRDGLYSISTLMGTNNENWYLDEQTLLEFTYALHNHLIPPLIWLETGDRVVVRENVRVRTGPTLSAGVIGAIDAGTELTRLAIYDTWSKIEFGGEIRYVASECLDSLEPEKVPETEAYVYVPETTEEETSPVSEDAGVISEVSETNEESAPMEGASETVETKPEEKKESKFSVKTVLLIAGGIFLFGVLLILIRIVIYRERQKRLRRERLRRRHKKHRSSHKA